MKTILRAALALGVLACVSSAPAAAQAIPQGATKEMVAKGNEIYQSRVSATPATAGIFGVGEGGEGEAENVETEATKKMKSAGRIISPMPPADCCSQA